MAKRFTATEIWAEDWYLDMPTEYKLFWHYLLSACNHAGLFKVNLRSFCGLNGVNICSDEALRLFNTGKSRIRIVKDGVWLIEDFFAFQYGSTLNPNNRVHASIEKEYKKSGVDLTSIRGLKDLKEGVKDKDKDKVLISIKGEGAELKKEDDAGPQTPTIIPSFSHEQNSCRALADTAFTEVYYQWGLTPEKLGGWLTAFNRKLSHDGVGWKTSSDYRKHFGHWLKFQKYTTTLPEDYSPLGPPLKDVTKNEKPSPIKVADPKAISAKYD